MAKRILIFDDEPDFTELMQAHLGFHEFEVDTRNDPAELEKTLDNEQYDLVITDLMMPNMNGFQVVEALRAREAYKETPIIVLSAKMLNDVERKMLLQNQAHVLAKPFEPQGLVDKITELLEPSNS
jgi:two-component system, chemotaxis family, chemotaxis protein CheY